MMRIAMLMLFGDRAALIGMLLGVGCAVLLITLQGAIFTGVMGRTVGILRDTPGVPIWVMDPTVQYIDDVKPLQEAEVQRVRGVAGVAWAAPLYKGLLRARLGDGTYQACYVIGLDGASLAGGPPGLTPERLAVLRQADGVIVDVAGAAGKLAQDDGHGGRRPLAVGDTLEINERRAVVAGLCEVSRNFGGQPTIYTTWERARRYAPRERRLLSFVIAAPSDGHDAGAVAARIGATTGLLAETRTDFMRHTISYYLRNTPIPINIGMGVVLSFLIGAAITGLTFAGFVHGNLRYLGALKAMGARNRLLLGLTALQALVVAGLGYGLGVGAAAAIGHALRDTPLAFILSWQLLLLAAAIATAISLIAATVSLRTVFRLDPAVVFR